MRKRSFLDEALRQATLKEQERIIKLFEESDSACAYWAIALIKGEM